MSDTPKPPLVGDVLGAGQIVAEGLEVLKEPVQTLFGPAWSEMAGVLGDSVRHWRDMRRLERAVAAVQKIKAKGLSPKAVDPSILFPILDAASLTDDEALKDKWESLLANAADPSSGVDVLPSFAGVLSQLSSLEAQILHSMFHGSSNDSRLTWRRIPPAGANPSSTDPYYADVLASKKEVKKRFGLSPTQYKVLTDNLQRLKIIQPTPLVIGEAKVMQYDTNTFRLTAFGRAFMQACSYDETSKVAEAPTEAIPS